MSASRSARESGSAGAVLPVALFGILIMSLLVATALLTASSELVLSRSYQDGMRSLHEADTALESFITSGAFEAEYGEARVIRTTSKGPGGKDFEITLTAFKQGEVREDSAGTLHRADLFSILAAPADGRGRVVGALIEATRKAIPFKGAIDAAATVGGDLTVSSNATLAALPQSTSTCSTVESPGAVRLGGGGRLMGSGESAVVGGVRQDTLAGSALVEGALGDSFSALSLGAEHYFGSAFGEAALSSFYGPRHDAASPDYRWGCPRSLVFACPEEAASETPLIVVDGSGGDVELDGGHGQGVLVIRGGGATLSGDFRFAGLVLVEGSLRVEGSAQILGAAVVAEGLVLGSSSEFGTDAPAIVFDGCSIAAAERALSLARLRNAPQTLDSPTFGWYEVVR